ncbi:MAG: trigger factor [Gammaproteobacteria bacterium]|nr:trigger factor [Gammaproteobacteria bacterium]
MQVSLENTASLERRLTVSLPAERLNGVVGQRLQEIARTAKLKGFRPGRIPPKVIEQRFGSQVREEAMGELIRQSFDEAVRQEKLQPAGNPDIRNEPKGEDGAIRYVATFEVVPDFGPIDVTKLSFDRVVAHVEDSDIDAMLETLRQQRQAWHPVSRPAQAGDLVRVETYARLANERIPAEGAEQGATVIGSNGMLPELEAQLVGMSAGEEREVEVTFPANWRLPNMAGQTATVVLKAGQVAESFVPEIDEAFIKSFGVRSGKLEVFRKEVRANLERELKGTLMNRLRAEVAQKLVAAYAHVELPPRLVEAEARSLALSTAETARQQGQANVTESPVPFMNAARQRVAAGLLVGEIARQNQLSLDPARVRETMQLIASTYEDPGQVIELYRNDPNLMRNLQNRVMEEQVIDWIAERANATEQSMTFADVMRPVA